MAITYLLDTNIFLEVLLGQERKDLCARFIERNIENSAISDFSFHSIGVILFRLKHAGLFLRFADDLLDSIKVLSLEKEGYAILVRAYTELGLDFDDAYQYATTKQEGLTLVTLDKDFVKAKDLKWFSPGEEEG